MGLPMLRKLAAAERKVGLWRRLACVRQTSSGSDTSTISSAVDSMILRSLKEHYHEIAKMNPPPRVHPPDGFTVIKEALSGNGPVLTRNHGNEEVEVSVMRLSDIITTDQEDDFNSSINQLFLHVQISKPGEDKSLHFLCGLYPDALGIHGVSMRSNIDTSGFLDVSSAYNPIFGELDDKMKDALHRYIEERGINENLFPFLQALVYVKEHRALMRWLKSLGLFVHGSNTPEDGSK